MKRRKSEEVWEEITVDLGETCPVEDARALARVLNSTAGQEFLSRVAESLVAMRRATKRRRLHARAEPVVDVTALPYLLTPREVAPLLRTTEEGVYARISRGHLTAADGLHREGRRVLFHRDRLLRSLERTPSGGRR